MDVLDLACGHGRIAGPLAARGCRVTGLDAVPLFLDRARCDAAGREVEVTYVHGDMRELPWTGRFDRVVNWFTAFGYFDDEGNRRVLSEVSRALKPGGRFALDLNNRDWIVGHFQPESVHEHEGDMVIERRRLEPLTGRCLTERIVVRDGKVRHVPSSSACSPSPSCATGSSTRASPTSAATTRTATRSARTATG
jgi:SAM-dependent methyltransferase